MINFPKKEGSLPAMAHPVQDSRVYRFGNFEVDLTAGELRKFDLKIKLQEKPFQLLTLLVARPGQLISREELRERLWEADTFVDFDQGLNTAVKKLRQALNDSAENPRYIETQPRKGYRFLAPVEAVTPPEESPVRLTPAPAEASPLVSATARKRRPWLLGIGISALVLLLAIFVFQRVRGRSSAPSRIESIAVLPLVNLSPDAGQEYFTDGVTDALITGLARIGTLRVISRTSAMQYKGTHKRLPEIARELNVDAVLEGTVFREKTRVRIDAKLIRASTDESLLEETYEGNLGDMLVLQNEVSSKIARRIAIKLTASEEYELSTSAPTNAQAYEAFLKGRFFWNKRSLPGLIKGMQYFQEAIAEDPRSAQAYAGLANCFNMLTFYGGQPPRDSFPKAKEAASRALELDEHSAEAHAALAFAKLHYDWDWSGAESEFRRAITLNPNYPDARHWFSHFLLARSRSADALAETRKALELDPLSLSINTHLGHHYLQTRNYDAAITQLRQTLEMYPSAEQVHFWLGRAYEAKRQFDEAARELQEAIELSPGNTQYRAALGHIRALKGDREAARSILHEMESRARKEYVSAYYMAVLYAGMRDWPHTLEQLRRAHDERAEGVLYLNIDPYFDDLRSQAEFIELTHSIGL